MPEHLIYRDLPLVFAGAAVGGLVAHRFRQPTILGYVLAGILLGPFTPAGVALLFRYPWQTAIRIGVGRTQISEFSYVLLQVARSASLVDDALYNCTLMASLLSILLNTILVRAATKFVPLEETAEAAA